MTSQQDDTKHIQGIINIGNSCYAASLVQCLRSSLSRFSDESTLLDTYVDGDMSSGIPSIWSRVDGNMQDPHEFYMKFMEDLPSVISRHFLIGYRDGNKMPCILIDNNLENSYGPISYAPDIICIYRVPSPKRITDFSSLEIDTIVDNIPITNRYRMSSCICFIRGRNGSEALTRHGYNVSRRDAIDHYYALVHHNDGWMKCDDSLVTPITNKRDMHPIYMIFYTKH